LNVYIMYGGVGILLLISVLKNKKKTMQSLKKAYKAFFNLLPDFLSIIMFVSIILALLNPETISKYIGENSGISSVFLSAIVGSVTLMPGFVAFPTAELLLRNGAGYMQIGAFVSSLMMVGVITLPMEIKYFGKKFAILRNIFAFIFSIFVAFFISLIMAITC